MTQYIKDQHHHLDLPKEFQGNFERTNNVSPISFDFILLAITLFFLLQDNK